MGKLNFSFPLGVSHAVSLLAPGLGRSPVTPWLTWEQNPAPLSPLIMKAGNMKKMLNPKGNKQNTHRIKTRKFPEKAEILPELTWGFLDSVILPGLSRCHLKSLS